MPSIREYDKRLASFKSSLKMTKTMKMVSASKLRKAQNTQRAAQEYAERLNAIIARLAASVGTEAHPLLQPREEAKRALLLVLSSDKGLCGGFNNNLFRAIQRWRPRLDQHFDDVRFSFAGKRGYMYFRQRVETAEHFEDVTQSPDVTAASRIARHLIRAFSAAEADEVWLIGNKFHSPLRQTPHFQKLLPISPREFTGDDGSAPPEPTEGAAEQEDVEALEYIYEPPQQELLSELIPRIVEFKVFYALLENAAGEHGARMTAMDNATSNAEDLIEQYTLLRNRARQANITTELTEIISGAEAL